MIYLTRPCAKWRSSSGSSSSFRQSRCGGGCGVRQARHDADKAGQARDPTLTQIKQGRQAINANKIYQSGGSGVRQGRRDGRAACRAGGSTAGRARRQGGVQVRHDASR